MEFLHICITFIHRVISIVLLFVCSFLAIHMYNNDVSLKIHYFHNTVGMFSISLRCYPFYNIIMITITIIILICILIMILE